MHETALMRFALDAVADRAREMNIDKISEVGLVIGRLSAVPAQMELAFKIVKGQYGPMFADAGLHLDVRGIRYRCRQCGCEYEVEDSIEGANTAVCPQCGSAERDVVSGNELEVEYFVPEK